jgi:hypothetical protein
MKGMGNKETPHHLWVVDEYLFPIAEKSILTNAPITMFYESLVQVPIVSNNNAARSTAQQYN